jgi:hypothetical protein
VRGARRTSALSSAVRFFTISCISCCAASVVRCASAGGTWGHTRVESPGATRSFSSGSICRAHLRVSARATTASDRLDLLLLEVDALHGRPSVGTGVQRRRESAKSCTATPACCVPHTTTNARLFKKDGYYEIVRWVLHSIHWTLILVAPCFRIS